MFVHYVFENFCQAISPMGEKKEEIPLSKTPDLTISSFVANLGLHIALLLCLLMLVVILLCFLITILYCYW